MTHMMLAINAAHRGHRAHKKETRVIFEIDNTENVGLAAQRMFRCRYGYNIANVYCMNRCSAHGSMATLFSADVSGSLASSCLGSMTTLFSVEASRCLASSCL